MARKVLTMLLMTAIISFAGVAAGGTGAAISAKVGTLGVGAEITAGIAKPVNLRVGMNYLNWDTDVNEDDDGQGSGNQLDLELDFQTVSMLVDVHPFKGGFRLTGGMFYNNNEINMTANLADSVEINDRDYYLSDIEGSITFDDFAPYFGIGYGNALDRDGRWQFVFDLGVLVQGSPNITLSATASEPLLQDALDADIAREIEQLEKDTEDYKYYPVLAVGLSYRF